MALVEKKRKSGGAARVAACILMYVLLALFIAGLFLFSFNYTKIYHSPAVSGGKADFAGVELPSRDVACNLAGDWEFFYNEWIVTDGVEREADGMICLPGLWTYRNFGKGSLPKTGYASYRLIAENVQSGVNVIVYRHYANFAYRVFINGKLNYRSGVLSKSASETKVTGNTDEQRPYATDGGRLEIVIELSATDTGGFAAAPWLAAVSAGISYGTSLRSVNYTSLGITTAAVAAGVLTYLFFRFRRDITLPAFMIALYLHFLSSKDMLYVIHWSHAAATLVRFLSAIAAFALFIAHLRRSGAPFKRIPVVLSAGAAVLFTVLSVAFYGTPLVYAFVFLLFATGCAYLVLPILNNRFAAVQKGVYGALFLFLMSVFWFELCDGLGLLVFGTEFIFTFELMLIIGCFAVLWLWKMAQAARTAIRVSELECELSSVKNQALRAQIKPHFVYNSLTAIQARYREGLDKGDKAIEQFARHLRLITDSDGQDIVSFESEVRNVMNYFELENLRADGKLNLLLDLEYTEFSLPVLSLQPLVENAIKHGGLRARQDGYVQLSSRKTDSFVEICVSDNGDGFDPDCTHTGVGLENTRKRFELLGASMRVESRIGQGTRVTVEIPLE